MTVLIELAALFATMTLPPIVRAQDGSALFAVWGCGTRGRARIFECHRGRRNHQLPERSAVAAGVHEFVLPLTWICRSCGLCRSLFRRYAILGSTLPHVLW